MPTIGQAVHALEERLFVGRERELTIFEDWLWTESSVPVILNVSGPGGVGKSALLRAFQRVADRGGRPVLLVDSRDFRATPEGFLRALGGSSTEEVIARLNATRPLLLLDTFEELSELTRYLQEKFLLGLDTAVKIVIAGRYPLGLAGSRDDFWRTLVRAVSLEGFSSDEGRTYLSERGLVDSGLVEQIIAVARSHPLALSLAADLALQFDVRNFAVAPEWRLIVHSLVQRLLQDVQDSTLRDLLAAGAVVRQFDEAMLIAISGQDEIGTAFDRLCRLSVIRPAEHGLMLHDDVRRILVDDLRWRRPESYRELRQRALNHYRERSRDASPADREWLMAERFFLWEHGFVQAMLFNRDEHGDVWLEPGRPDDHEDVLWLEGFWQENILPMVSPGPITAVFDLTAHLKHWSRLLHCPGMRLRIARDRTGKAIGYGLIATMCRESIEYLDDPHLSPMIDSYWSPSERAMLPRRPEDSNIFCIIQLVFTAGLTDVTPEAINAVLLRDVLSVLARDGVNLCMVGIDHQKQLLETCGFEPIPGAQSCFRGMPMQGYALDLTQTGVEAWIEAVMSGRQPPRAPRPAELASDLQAVLVHWHDSRWLAQSPLLQSTLDATESAPEPEALREIIRGALVKAREDATSEQELAYRALELAYLTKSVSHGRAAEQIAVSRTTFYRLLKRGVQGLAKTLARV